MAQEIEKVKKKQVIRDKETLIPVILERIADGESLTNCCKDLNIPFGTAANWFHERADENSSERKAKIAAQYRRARELGAIKHVDEMVSLTQNAMTDDTINPQILKIHCDNIKWYASRLYRSVYGDKEPSGGDTVNNTLNITMDNREAARTALALLAASDGDVIDQ